jgi:YbbR domain-containing protein
MMITSPVPDYVEVRVSGSGLVLSSIDAKRLRVSVDLSGVKPGVATYSFNPEIFGLPRKAEVVRVTPSRVSFHVDRLVQRTLPVRVERQGELQPGLELKEVAVIPDKVEVGGPKTTIEGLRAVDTEPVDFSLLTAGVKEVDVALIDPGPFVQVSAAEVHVRLTTAAILADKKFDLPVVVRNSDLAWNVVPDRVSVVVRGPESKIEALELPASAAYLDGRTLVGPGPHRVAPRVDLPAGFEVVRVDPREVAVELGQEGKDDQAGTGPPQQNGDNT